MAGKADRWYEVHIDEDPEEFDCTITCKGGDAALAVATISCDLQSLKNEDLMEGR
jgi:hypothetical protein